MGKKEWKKIRHGIIIFVMAFFSAIPFVVYGKNIDSQETIRIGYVTTYQIGKYSYINYLIEEQDYKEQELEKTKNFWYKESGFDLVKTLYKGKLNEGKLKKLKKLLEEIDD